MTDHELTVLSAEAMGYAVKVVCGAPTDTVFYQRDVTPKPDWCEWNPLKQDAQAMALVKKLGLTVDPAQDDPPFDWRVVAAIGGDWDNQAAGESDDLNRAIVQCAAALHRASTDTRHRG